MMLLWLLKACESKPVLWLCNPWQACRWWWQARHVWSLYGWQACVCLWVLGTL